MKLGAVTEEVTANFRDRCYYEQAKKMQQTGTSNSKTM